MSLFGQWRHNFYSSTSLSEVQKADERKKYDYVMQMDGVGGSKLFRAFETRDQFYSFLMDTKPEDRCFYETIFDHQLQKPKFDIDIKCSRIPEGRDDFHLEILGVILSTIQRVIPGLDPANDMAVYQSHGEDKYSFHIILTGYYVLNNMQANNFANLVLKSILDDDTNDMDILEKINEFTDLSVYKSLQQFRLIYCSKLGKNRFKVPVEEFMVCGETYKLKQFTKREEFDRSLVANVDENKMILLEIGSDKEIIERKPPPEDAPSWWWMEPEKVYEHVCKEHLPPSFSLNFGRFDAVRTMILLRSPPDGYFCPICNRRHQNENPFMYLKSRLGVKCIDIIFKCRRKDAGEDFKVLCSMYKLGERVSFECEFGAEC